MQDEIVQGDINYCGTLCGTPLNDRGIIIALSMQSWRWFLGVLLYNSDIYVIKLYQSFYI